jgi:hypothetical protein
MPAAQHEPVGGGVVRDERTRDNMSRDEQRLDVELLPVLSH